MPAQALLRKLSPEKEEPDTVRRAKDLSTTEDSRSDDPEVPVSDWNVRFAQMAGPKIWSTYRCPSYAYRDHDSSTDAVHCGVPVYPIHGLGREIMCERTASHNQSTNVLTS